MLIFVTVCFRFFVDLGSILSSILASFWTYFPLKCRPFSLWGSKRVSWGTFSWFRVIWVWFGVDLGWFFDDFGLIFHRCVDDLLWFFTLFYLNVGQILITYVPIYHIFLWKNPPGPPRWSAKRPNARGSPPLCVLEAVALRLSFLLEGGKWASRIPS